MIAALAKSSGLSRAARGRSRTSTTASPILKRGIALTPVKFGISFTTLHLNQAGALVHVYHDGSVHLNHGGTEMGQGLFIKVAQVVAEEFGIDLDQVKITPTTTAKVPNTSATAASSGSDLNGMAARAAAATIKERLIDFAGEAFGVPPEQVAFRDNQVVIGNTAMPFPELVKKAYFGARVAVLDRLLQDAEDPLGPGQGDRPAVLLFRLWRGVLRSADRHAHRRDEGRRASTSSTTSAARSIRRSTSARSRAASSRAWAGSPPRNWSATPRAGC